MRDSAPDTLNVSRETLDKLRAFQALVRKWSPKINLVSRNDLESLWSRHILDSAQLAGLAPAPADWLDLGSGGGFPGVVVAILLHEERVRVTLVESDKRKCAFLGTAARILDLNVEVVPARIEDIRCNNATTLSARSLAPLEKLMGYAHTHLAADGTALFPKGRNWKNELQAAKDKWSFDSDVVQSTTDSGAVILRLCNIKRI